MNLSMILSDILRREGWPTISNRPADRGGLTKGGVTYRSYSAYLKQQGRPPITEFEFHNLTEDQAREFMMVTIAGPVMNVAMLDPQLFTVLFDWAETSGPNTAIRALQEELQERHLILKVDGLYGPATEATLHAYWDAAPLADRLSFIQAVRNRRAQFYLKLALDDELVVAFRGEHPDSQLENLHGWLTRAQIV